MSYVLIIYILFPDFSLMHQELYFDSYKDCTRTVKLIRKNRQHKENKDILQAKCAYNFGSNK